MNNSWERRILAWMLVLSLVLAAAPMKASAAPAFTEVGSWNESIFAVLSGVSDAQVTKVSWSGTASGSLTGEDFTYLVRDVEGGVRIDIPGLKPGTYTLSVETMAGNLTERSIAVTAYDRSGYAHWNYTEGVGAYKDDGTLKANAVVLYVTEATKNTVSVTAGGLTVKGIGNILNTGGKASSSGLTSKGGLANTNEDILKKLANENRPLVVRIIGRVTAPEGLTAWDSIDYGGNTDDNGSMANMSSCKNITIEGIGSGALVDGWGFAINTSTNDTKNGWGKNFEFRNLTFKNVPEDCIGFSGKQNSENTALTDPIQHCWVHHCAFYGPTNIKDASVDQDKGGGDGALDFKRGLYMTMGYCYFEGYHKTNLIGGSDNNLQYHITWHHNHYKNCESRAPLGRQANMHLYNNLFEGQSSYCMSLRANCYIFSEYNNYINCKQVSNSSNGGVCKSYQNNFENCTGQNAADIKIVTDKNQTVTSGNLYAGFELDSTLSYIPGGDYSLQADTAAAKATVLAQAGPQRGDSEEDSGSTEPTDPVQPDVEAGDVIHNFTANQLSSDFFAITGNLSAKGTVNYAGLTMTKCLKMESATKVTFEAPVNGDLLLVFHPTGLNSVSAAGSTVKLDGTAYTVGSDSTLTIPVTAGSHTLTKGNNQIFLYYMAYLPEKADLIDIPAVSMRLGSNLGMYFYVAKTDVAAGDYAVVTKHYAEGLADRTITVPITDWLSAGSYYLIAFDGIAAKEMTDEVNCVIYDADDKQISIQKTTSVQTYAHLQLDAEATTSELKTVLVDMLNYGAAAQVQFAYNTAVPANGNLTDDQKAYGTASIDMTNLGGYVEKGNGWAAGALTLKSSFVMNIFLDGTVVNQGMTAEISYTNHNGNAVSYSIPGSEFQNYANTHWILNINDLVAADLATVVSVDIYDGTTLVGEHAYNMAAYCETMASSAPAVALAKYCSSAYNYFH